MEKVRSFDPVLYDIGDKVIRKFKDGKNEVFTITRTEIINNMDNLSYQILFFNNSNEPFVAFEFEPYDKNDRKAYYDILNTAKPIKSKSVKSKEVKAKSNLTIILEK